MNTAKQRILAGLERKLVWAIAKGDMVGAMLLYQRIQAFR